MLCLIFRRLDPAEGINFIHILTRRTKIKRTRKIPTMSRPPAAAVSTEQHEDQYILYAEKGYKCKSTKGHWVDPRKHINSFGISTNITDHKVH